MAEDSQDKIKIELEVPKAGVRVESISAESQSEKTKAERNKAERSGKKDEKTVAGYKPAEIAKALLEPPEPEDKKSPSAGQKTLVVFGFAVVGVSIVLWPLFNFALFVGVAIAGAAVVAFGSLVRV